MPKVSDILTPIEVDDILYGLGASDKGRSGYESSDVLKHQALNLIKQDYDQGPPDSVLREVYSRLVQPVEGSSGQDVEAASGLVENGAKFFLTTFSGRLASALVRWTLGVARRVIWATGRFIVTRLIIPVITGLASMLLTPAGLAVVAGAGLAYWLYNAFFKQNGAALPNAKDVDLTDPNAWEKKQEEYDALEGYLESRGGTETFGTRNTPQDFMRRRLQDNEPLSLGVDEELGASSKKLLKFKITDQVRDAISVASMKTGVPEDTLNAIAYKESTFNPNARAEKGSASGLFQFISGTWKEVIRKYGDKYGVAKNANPFNPYDSALVAAIYLKEDIYKQISKVKPNPTPTDLYMGHFMGPEGGREWLKQMEISPNRYAYLDQTKKVLSNNHDVYFMKDNTPRTYYQIYRMFQRSITQVVEATKANTLASKSITAPLVTKPLEVAKADNNDDGGSSQASAPGGYSGPNNSSNSGSNHRGGQQVLRWKNYLIMAPQS